MLSSAHEELVSRYLFLIAPKISSIWKIISAGTAFSSSTTDD